MRERSDGSNPDAVEGKTALGAASDAAEIPYDEKRYFESFYRATVRGEPSDRMTIGAISEPESRFHYNAVENSIIRGITRHEPLPSSGMIEAWRFMQRRRNLRLLDIGSGTGHWIDFFRQTFLITEAVAVEITNSMTEFLQEKYADVPEICVRQLDIGRTDLADDELGEPFDYISAIGVMFHIVDDGKWRQALQNLARLLKSSGLLLIGGEFGAETRNVQFHKVDEFETWQEHAKASFSDGVRVNKRVRSVADWHRAANLSGLEICDLIRSDADRHFRTPENDLLVLRHANNDEKNSSIRS